MLILILIMFIIIVKQLIIIITMITTIIITIIIMIIMIMIVIPNQGVRRRHTLDAPRAHWRARMLPSAGCTIEYSNSKCIADQNFALSTQRNLVSD